VRRKLLILRLLSLIVLLHVAPPIADAEGGGDRRVNVPYFGDGVAWAESAVFWLGKVDPPGAPGKNYADIRVAYTAEELAIFVNVVDYYFWYDPDDAQPNDPTDYDAVAIFLDTAHDGAGSPQQDDYTFTRGLCLYGCGDGSRFYKEGRGTGTGWDMAWTADWTAGTWASWHGNPPHNNNTNLFDYGWWTYIHLPWEALGRTGPPASGTVWGLGVILYDRDDLPPAGAVAPQSWPQDLGSTHPDTWGELNFGVPAWDPPAVVEQGTTVIRRGLGQSVVEDSWVGGGGTCSGGHEGDPYSDNYGTSADLFVENQELIADFPCFSKSFLRFHLDPIPAGKVIMSATLSLHHWSNADWTRAEPSLIWLSTVDGNWEENTLTWNNAPLARANLSATWVDVITPENSPDRPGVRYDWDATQAVAEAYAAREPLNIALYTADVNFHSSKYLTASDTGDWNAEGRPTLTIIWGQEPQLNKYHQTAPASPEIGLTSGDTITYTLEVEGSGQALDVVDVLPAQISHPLAYDASAGAVAYDPAARKLTWAGTPGVGQTVVIVYPVTVMQDGTYAIINTAYMTAADGGAFTARSTIIVEPRHFFLPCVLRQR